MNTKNVWLFVGILLAVSLAGFFLLKKPQTNLAPSDSPTPTAANPETKEDNMEEEDESVTEIKVLGKEFSYAPSTINVKNGEKVKITFTNSGTMMHDLVIEDLDIRTKMVAPGGTDTLEFTVPDKASSLTFYCSVGGHRALGMEGTFLIK
ncbi:cupredoxin domain-containing protein [Candidatus Woesebacteria bacterium]|nr:cupredoxin domain-containing protein [Candidatus Woesebacteria bacterium]